MKKLVLIVVIMCAGFLTQAQEKNTKKNKNAKYEIEVNGNCDMCKKRIERAAYSVRGVKSAQWHSNHQDMHLIIDENRTSIDEVHQAIADAGHDTNKVRAKEEVYQELHSCCLYERKK